MLIYFSSGNMSQVILKKQMEKVDFLTTSQYEKAIIPKSPRFMVRQGDLIVTNYRLARRRTMGLTYALTYANSRYFSTNIYVFRGSHIIITLKDKTVLIHKEHGIVEIPENENKLNFYTFGQASD